MNPLFIVLFGLLVKTDSRWYALKQRPPLRDPHARLMTRVRRWLRFKRAQLQAAAIQRAIRRRYAYTIGTYADGSAAAPPADIKVGYLQLTPEEKARIERDGKAIKAFLVQGFRDDPELKAAIGPAVRQELDVWEKETDPRTRPGFNGSPPKQDEPDGVDLKRLGAMRRAIVDKATGKQVSSADVTGMYARELPGDQTWGSTQGGWLPPMQLVGNAREAAAREFADIIKSDDAFAILKFPRGDIENFSVCRWAMALERSQNTAEGTTAFAKWAPWEAAYYAALERYNTTKAQGDMVSGQDGGYLAPELWSTQFIDQIYPATATGRLPIKRIPMGTRVVHVPRLNANITVSYAAENAALTASQAQFQQVSFTARKQYAFVQISNELIRDSNPAAMTILQNNAAQYMAIDQDYQILLGNGLAGSPTGLYNATNVTKANGTNGGGFTGGSAPAGVGSNSKYPTITDLETGIFNVEDLNNSTNVPPGQTSCTGIVGAVALKLLVAGATDNALGVSGGSDRPLYDFGYNQMRWNNRKDGSSALDGILGVDQWVLTNVIKHALLAGSGGASAAPTSNSFGTAMAAANMNPVFFGDWQHVWVMERQDIEVLASNVAGTAFSNDQTWIRMIRRYDVGIAHPEAFYVVTNA